MRVDISDWSVRSVYGLEFWLFNFSRLSDWYVERIGDRVYITR